MTKPGAEPSLPPGEPAEQFLEDFLNPSGGTRVRSGTAWRPPVGVFDVGGAHVVVVVPVPRKRAPGRVDIRVEE